MRAATLGGEGKRELFYAEQVVGIGSVGITGNIVVSERATEEIVVNDLPRHARPRARERLVRSVVSIRHGGRARVRR